eukprot:200836-Chlamydomonas_euryale.AAC.6
MTRRFATRISPTLSFDRRARRTLSHARRADYGEVLALRAPAEQRGPAVPTTARPSIAASRARGRHVASQIPPRRQPSFGGFGRCLQRASPPACQ